MGERISVVVAARDEAAMIDGCLQRLGFADEVIVVIDDRTEDDTAARCEAADAVVISHRFTTFAALKNAGIDAATGDWILIVDADERVTAALADEVAAVVGLGDAAADAYRVPIENWFFGRRMRFGGWQERPVRLFRRHAARYTGDLHEVLHFEGAGETGDLRRPLVHFSHRSIHHNLAKTAAYADVQAAELLAAGHPTVTWRTLLRVVGRELLRRLLKRQGWRDGMPGVIEGVYQPFSLFVVYVRLWELQQRPSLDERYRELEQETA